MIGSEAREASSVLRNHMSQEHQIFLQAGEREMGVKLQTEELMMTWDLQETSKSKRRCRRQRQLVILGHTK